MTLTGRQQRILCIRPGLNDLAGTILTDTSNEWVEALSLHAKVMSVEQDFDFAEICEQFQPDLVILDAVNWTRPRTLTIAHARSNPTVPRLLFLNSDPHDPMRPLTFRMAEDLGMEDVFITGEAYRQHMPELARYRCYFVPQFIDTEIYRDYGLEKSIPISVFGGHLLPEFYPWRARLLAEIQHVLPTMIFPHPGYQKGVEIPFAVKGDAYARILARSYFSIADTTRLDYGVRKHMEIPACGAVLIAPESDALTSYGFVDLDNCLLGEGAELYDKISRVALQPERYRQIRQAGMDLVSQRYSRTSWRLMLDWLDCHQRLEPGQMVQQTGRYAEFRPVPVATVSASVAARSQRDSAMTAALRKAQTAILTGLELDAGEAAAQIASGWVGHIAEPHLLLGLFQLLRGDSNSAVLSIMRRPKSQGDIHSAHSAFDPVEIAWLLIVSRLIDNEPFERMLRVQAESMHHVGIRRSLWLLNGSSDPFDDGIMTRRPGDAASVHWLGDEPLETWLSLVQRVFMAHRGSASAIATKQTQASQ